MSIFFHEQLYRNSTLMEKIANASITICGAGAIGANLSENLARSGFKQLKIIDRDRIEERNLSTQPYYQSDIGAYKATMLTNSLYRALGIAVDGVTKELTEDNCHKFLKNSHLVIDAFDNSNSRQLIKDYCLKYQLPCLHVGLQSDYAEVIWNDLYRVPSATNDDICDYPLARNIAIMAVAIATEVMIQFLDTGDRQNYTITLKDFAVKSFP